MKTTFPMTAAAQMAAKRIPTGLCLAVAVFFAQHHAMAVPVAVNLGTAGDFAVVAGAGITVAGAVNSTTITGDIGTYPTTSITGLGNVVLNGVNHGGDSVTMGAKNDLVIAYNDAAGRSPNTTYSPIFDLGGLTLMSGVYKDPTSFGLTGTLILDGGGNADAVFIFQTGSTLTTASGSKVTLINGAQACHVFWQIGSSATLGTMSDFVGNILALESITVTTGATVDGRLLARNGAVTLDNNTIIRSDCDTDGNGGHSVPDAGSTLLLLGSGLATLLGFGRRLVAAV